MGSKQRRSSRIHHHSASPAIVTIHEQIDVGRYGHVSGLLVRSDTVRALYVLAHGAGAGMEHPFLESVALDLAKRGIATLRYQFPYMEQGRKSPDSPTVATAAVRAAVQTAAEVAPGVPLVAGGKSFGGRMTSTAASQEQLTGVRGLVFLGFPLHRPGVPGDERAAHLQSIGIPMLFLQGTRDSLADLGTVTRVCDRLGVLATLHVVEGGDHSFRVPKNTGRSGQEVMAELGRTIDQWVSKL